MRNVQLVQGTGVLAQPPISGGRLIQDLQQYRPVHALMSNENDCLVMMMFQDKRMVSAARANRSCRESPWETGRDAAQNAIERRERANGFGPRRKYAIAMHRN